MQAIVGAVFAVFIIGLIIQRALAVCQGVNGAENGPFWGLAASWSSNSVRHLIPPCFGNNYGREATGVSMAGLLEFRGIFVASSGHLVNKYLSFQLLTKCPFVGRYISGVRNGLP
jgi:hypothetical protein